ncbi:transcriptional regulator [Streptomyces sp. A7024]|uniref:Transcriptional regulator n=1 Tax=Streptomyces coryli TaxID=1128680 RepID=A0A6G4TWM5_9ACTN|nr:transcriptional regulator [Streptomyces coryli]
MTKDLNRVVSGLRAAGGYATDVEVKSAASGLPDSLASTLGAFANLPGGGMVILGLDKRSGFRPVPLTDMQGLRQALAEMADAFSPPIRLTVEDAEVDGSPVLAATVHECERPAKPCRLAASGAAYMRGYECDYQLSELEEQAYPTTRFPPAFDRQPVSGAKIDDLDHELTTAFLQAVRERDPYGLGRFADDAELMVRAGILLPEGTPSVAGLLALGVHPQQFFPRYTIQLAADPHPSDPLGTRARNQITLTGAIPRMLDQALDWARRTFDTTITSEADGVVRDQPEYPLLAFRELIANALVHRDLDQWSAGMAIEVRLRPDRLVISNPGGLYGLSMERLGREAVTSARNARLVAICQHARSPQTGSRVIEALASGIPAVSDVLNDAGLPPAQFIDAGIRFTAVLHKPTPQTASKPLLNATELSVYDFLTAGPHPQQHTHTVTDLQTSLGYAPNIIR